jgi:hypothetical protein
VLAVWAASPPACSNPCLDAARGARKACVSSAGGVFVDLIDGCLERDRVCLDACRMEQRDCVAATDLDAALATCQQEEAAAKQRCHDTFPLGSRKWKRCIYHAEADGSRCRRHAGRDARAALKSCRAAFQQCAGACGPGTPPGGAEQCKQDAKAALAGLLGDCKSSFQLQVSACIDRDPVCVQACGDERTLCRAPVAAALQAALAACQAQRDAAIAQCEADNPGGGTALEQCVETAQANAFACNDAALAAAAPGFAACTSAWAACIQACPAPSAGAG